MELNILEINHHKIAKVIADKIVINDTQDALDVIANANYQGAQSVILEENQLNGSFFNLRTGLAGEVLQKCANYKMKLAIVGDFEKYQSNSLNAFIVECNRGNSVFFVANRETAISKLAS